MCHKYLTFDFGDQLNFIVGERYHQYLFFMLTYFTGHNGSKFGYLAKL